MQFILPSAATTATVSTTTITYWSTKNQNQLDRIGAMKCSCRFFKLPSESVYIPDAVYSKVNIWGSRTHHVLHH